MFYQLLLVFLGSALSFTAVYMLLFGKSIALAQHADAILNSSGRTIRERELSNPVSNRVIKPFVLKIAALTYRLLPSEKEALLLKKIQMAGRPGGLGPKEIISLKVIVSASAFCLITIIGPILNIPGLKLLLLTGLLIAAGWYFPDFFLRQKVIQRKNEAEKSLPDILDLLTVSVEAGMGFDGALLKVVDKGKGVIAEEFLQVLNECKMGKNRREALRDMADRVELDDLTTFTSSIIQAEQLGLGIGNVLRVQSEQMRRKRRQRAEERAMKAPVKMLIPMVLFIFPAIFVVLLGPAVIKIMEIF